MAKTKDESGRFTFYKKHNEQYKDKNWLYNQYVVQKKPRSLIGQECGVSASTIGNQLRKFTIAIRHGHDFNLIHPKKYMDKEWLANEYLSKTMTTIGKENGVSHSTILKWTRHFNIPSRNNHERRLGKFHYKFNGERLVYPSGYVYLYSPEHPRAKKSQRKYYVPEHVLVMEKHLGRLLTDKEEVHHNDGDKQNNNINNLKLFANSSEHIKYEMKTRDFSKKLLFGNIPVSNRDELLCLFNEFVNEH